ncbi:putative ALK tyrosine kinase receptor-like [Scophthalmus maximus]|uniref:Putative ALK tyrosine kinase receptor-like n=1 Tax=Scophthalmus maximus TaxID=52904 RepID=A0A2U9CK00_SCOMX|nr:putative ALK tyrosine kinase receptor-like [Scophthalmus maximus]
MKGTEFYPLAVVFVLCPNADPESTPFKLKGWPPAKNNERNGAMRSTSLSSEPLAGRTTAGSPRGHWSFSWVAEDDLSFPNNSVSMSDHQCPGDSGTCDQQVDGFPEFTWSIVAAGDLREERNEKTEKKTGSPQGWEEDVNVSDFRTMSMLTGSFNIASCKNLLRIWFAPKDAKLNPREI